MAQALKQTTGTTATDLVHPRNLVQGWGADLALESRPGVPREKPSVIQNAYGPAQPRQEPTMRVDVSVEHRELTPVFGEAVAPRGVSGLIRRYAYQLSEGKARRWMALLIADRVDAWEGRAQDLARGILPNPYREGGWKAGYRYDRKDMIQRSVIFAAAGVAVIFLLTRKRRRQ